MQQSYDTSSMPDLKGTKIVILQSKWYKEYTDTMSRRCTELLEKAGASVVTHLVPGSLEIPLCAQTVLKNEPLDAVVCIGILMKGETHHYEMILQSLATGMQQVSLEFGVPLINAILPSTTMEQVIARASDNDANKGIEAALAAAEYISWQRTIKGCCNANHSCHRAA